MTFYLQRAFHAFKTNPHLTFHSTIATNVCGRENRCHYYPYLTDKKTKAHRGQMPAKFALEIKVELRSIDYCLK